ncbi:Tenascin-R,Ryncolin-2,Angiopoietin-related protein 1,Ficolin-1-A,Ryncolin-1,Tenascin-X,Ficolin-2,Fibrinogen-like protein 1,Tenascin,Ficolin-1,Fibrinogen-like protein A,Ficolin-1-B,Ryncolin-3,Angiopoietin-related protein 7,Angiopoietin-4,Ryncolin-4 [Mytilus edulis]|uniref:Fibrinogen C-terminal domain-containing protein n=1 Tax=Mytilus edulis TaxID=6550 RepID=A0A8S3V639_MYTED|nr:Tenascin-R,Ryncolin-2,Angiopoietin-related protein 1,Ficolin-1-A,Ryncolin-1,Tenascin-X,Ficolin-2,Fibrinogen-like protein 1,Tenascin,Ficolin-1,Fibrinogen-like protein A,Ficolin-1-B,Ryncolin-3,Angiopoietin-related protein 7,Angiopoietin-4,Ryncolin-4 [Mytilus edulis]
MTGMKILNRAATTNHSKRKHYKSVKRYKELGNKMCAISTEHTCSLNMSTWKSTQDCARAEKKKCKGFAQKNMCKTCKDCTELKKYNEKSDVYKISARDSEVLKVYCDMTTDGGGWSIIQRHYDGTVDFQRTWFEYENGFGNVEGEYWLGNKHIHHMTSSGKYELRIDLTDNKNEKRYAAYKQFSIGDAASKYKLSIGSYSGNAGDSMKYHNGMMFSATDQDNDQAGGDCTNGIGPWWHKSCSWSALNRKLSSNLHWHTFPNHAAKTSIMMIRRI